MPDRRDTNHRVASLLRDLAAAQSSTQKRWAYKRAAAAILALEEPLETYLLPDGTLRRIPHIGSSSTRVILEVLATGHSATEEAAVAESLRARDIERSQEMRTTFLSRAQVDAALRNGALRAPASSPTGTRCVPPRRRHEWRSRSTAIRRTRTSTSKPSSTRSARDA